jgi:hypothetical protein
MVISLPISRDRDRAHPDVTGLFAGTLVHHNPTKMALSDFFSSLKSTIYADSEEKEPETPVEEATGEAAEEAAEEEEEEPEDVRPNLSAPWPR